MEQLLRLSQLARTSGISRHLLTRAIREKALPHVQIGKAIYIRPAAFQEWVEQQEHGSDEINEFTPIPVNL